MRQVNTCPSIERLGALAVERVPHGPMGHCVQDARILKLHHSPEHGVLNGAIL